MGKILIEDDRRIVAQCTKLEELAYTGTALLRALAGTIRGEDGSLLRQSLALRGAKWRLRDRETTEGANLNLWTRWGRTSWLLETLAAASESSGSWAYALLMPPNARMLFG